MIIEPTHPQLDELASRLVALVQEAVAAYTPVVESLIRSGSQNTNEIEQTLDVLLGFCGNEQSLLLYRQLCRHYYAIDPAAAVEYVRAYREMWDSDASTEVSL